MRISKKKKKRICYRFCVVYFPSQKSKRKWKHFKDYLKYADKRQRLTCNCEHFLRAFFRLHFYNIRDQRRKKKKKGTKKVNTFSPTLILSSLEKGHRRGRCHFNTIMEHTICSRVLNDLSRNLDHAQVRSRTYTFLYASTHRAGLLA